jgi:NAD(P)-dependent dehydrogenase (short-subunit alcohol dehydrogenase family)
MLIPIGSGIGRAVAVACAREGCRSLVLADVNLARSKETEDLIHQDFSGIETLTIQVDISDVVAVVAMVSRAVETFGSLDHGEYYWLPKLGEFQFSQCC